MFKNVSKKAIFVIIFILIISVLGGVYFGIDSKSKVYFSNVDKYIEEREYHKAKAELNNAKNIFNSSKVSEKEKEINICIEQENTLNSIDKLIENKDYSQALVKLESIEPKSNAIRKIVDERLELYKNELINIKSNEIDTLISNKNFDDAYKILDEIKNMYKDNKDIEALKAKIDSEKDNYEKEQVRISELNNKLDTAENNIKDGNLDNAQTIINELKNEELDDNGEIKLANIEASLKSAQKEKLKEKQKAQLAQFEKEEHHFDYKELLKYVEKDLGTSNLQPGQQGWAFDSEKNLCIGWIIFNEDDNKYYNYCYYSNGEFKRDYGEIDAIGTGLEYDDLLNVINTWNN